MIRTDLGQWLSPFCDDNHFFGFCDLIDNLSIGQEVDVHFNLRGRKWTDPKGEVKYFNSLQAWRIDPVSATPPQELGDPGAGQEPAWLNADDSTDDDLPF